MTFGYKIELAALRVDTDPHARFLILWFAYLEQILVKLHNF